MASTMQAWRTGISLSKADMYAKINEFFPDIYDWESVDTSTENQVDYYISDNIFLRVTENSIIPYNGSTAGTGLSFPTQSNLTIYKLNGCIMMCVTVGNYNVTQYSQTAQLIVDTVNNETGTAIIYNFNAGYCYLFDETLSTAQVAYYPYNVNYSIRTNTSLAQVAPFINNISGKSFDNLYGVLITPVMNAFVDFGGQKWLFSNGFALPAGDSEPTYTYV